MSFDESLCSRFGFLDRQLFRIFRAAEFPHRADVAFRFIRQANERAQIDKRGIETRSIAFGNKSRGIFPQFFAADPGIDRGAHVEQPCEHTRTVRFDDWDRLIESKRRDRVCRVTANAGQLANRNGVAGKDASTSSVHDFRCGVEISGAIVIAKTLPGVEDRVLRGACN